MLLPGAEAVQEPERQQAPLLGATAGRRARAGRRGGRHAGLSLPAADVPLTDQTSPGEAACESPASWAQKEEQNTVMENRVWTVMGGGDHSGQDTLRTGDARLCCKLSG